MPGAEFHPTPRRLILRRFFHFSRRSLSPQGVTTKATSQIDIGNVLTDYVKQNYSPEDGTCHFHLTLSLLSI